jgi:hypothetical protein
VIVENPEIPAELKKVMSFDSKLKCFVFSSKTDLSQFEGNYTLQIAVKDNQTNSVPVFHTLKLTVANQS